MKRILLYVCFALPLLFSMKAQGQTPSCTSGTPGTLVVNLAGSGTGLPLGTPAIDGTTTVCFATASPSVTFTGSGGTKPYTFTYKINNGADLTVSTSGEATSVTVPAPTDVAGTFTYTLVSVGSAGSGSCSKDGSGATAVITVRPKFTAGRIASTGETICEGDDAALTIGSDSLAAGGNETITYRWQKSTDGIAFTTIPDSARAVFNPGVLTQDTWFRRQAKDGVCNTDFTAVGNTSRGVWKVTVNNMEPGSITGNQTICEGGNPAVFGSVAASGDGTFTYMWQMSTDGTTFTDIDSTRAVLDVASLSVDTWYKRLATSTNTVNGTQTCTEESNVIKVTVNNLTPSVIASAQEFCAGGNAAALTVTTPAVVDGAPTYQWELSLDNITWSVIDTGTLATFDPHILNDTTWYRVKVTSTLGLSACSSYSNSVKITVNPNPTASTCITPDNCQAGNGNIIVNIDSGTPPYSVENKGIYNISTNTGNKDANVFTLPADVNGIRTINTTTPHTNPKSVQYSNLPGNATYKIKVTDSKGCSVGSTD